MSPEQARGQAVDTRTDIWAFGCVLYELLTARKPFAGGTVTDVVAAIISREPDWQALPPGTPARIRSLLVRCLRKDPAQRLRDIADGRFQIEDALDDPGLATPVVTPARSYRERAAWIAAAVLLGTTGFLAARPSTPPVSRDAISVPVLPPDKAAFSAAANTTVNVPSFALSPDGRALVFSAETPGGRPMLWLQSLDRLDARPLAGTEDAQSPFWSPDSRSVGFFADGALKRVPATGGTVQIIKQTIDGFRGATWGSRNTILLATGVEGVGSLDAAGGTITPVTVIDASLQENSHRNPYFCQMACTSSTRPSATAIAMACTSGRWMGRRRNCCSRALRAPSTQRPGTCCSSTRTRSWRRRSTQNASS